ncbi:hypothetical protein [Micromonospora sp. WMMD1082]|uniref:hypothetical protein n=1 Tax=Micromonospora sp. WMMD1082 TaxID=3016104 RepID=UPI00241659B2|nr:hypothetical protein [Micromonospora sp. WMMD1082]MDG4796177.1 hypothetical protein [Micromonospora sp. WMMD1082]
MSSHVDGLDGGLSTARVSAAEADRAHREQQEADALRWLLRNGHADVAEMLGLVEPDRPAPRGKVRKHRKQVTR